MHCAVISRSWLLANIGQWITDSVSGVNSSSTHANSLAKRGSADSPSTMFGLFCVYFRTHPASFCGPSPKLGPDGETIETLDSTFESICRSQLINGCIQPWESTSDLLHSSVGREANRTEETPGPDWVLWFQQAAITSASHILCHVKTSCLVRTHEKKGPFLLYSSPQGRTLITPQTSWWVKEQLHAQTSPSDRSFSDNCLDWDQPWLRRHARIKYTNGQEMSIKMQHSFVWLAGPLCWDALPLPGSNCLSGPVCAPSWLDVISHRRPFVSLSFDSWELDPHSDWSQVSTDWPWHTTQNMKRSRQPTRSEKHLN